MNDSTSRSHGANSRRIMTIFLVFVLLAIACSSSAPEPTQTAPPPPTDTTEPTATDTPLPPPTDTPEPAATDTPEPTETNTPEPTATDTPDLAGTAAFEGTAAAAVLLEDIYARLADVNQSPESGTLGWSQDEVVDLDIRTYNTQDWFPIDDGEDFHSFVLYSEVTWESTGGYAICGFVLRAENANLGNAKHYLFQTIRLSGLPSWDVELWQYGQWQSTTSGTIRAAPAIDQDNGATNIFTLVADQSTLTIYGNGTRLGTVVISSIEEGQVGFYAWQESGETTCSYDNSWLWILED